MVKKERYAEIPTNGGFDKVHLGLTGPEPPNPGHQGSTSNSGNTGNPNPPGLLKPQGQ